MSEETHRTAEARATMKTLFGVEMALTAREGEPAVALDMHRIQFEHAFADSWSRPGLDTRSRSLVTVAMLAAMGADREMRTHVAGALSLGITAEELVEVFIHLGVYAGVARAHPAWQSASEVIEKVTARRATGRTPSPSSS